MPIGLGKYDSLCTVARESTMAEGVLLIVINGVYGSGFSAQVTPEILANVSEFLRRTADDIDQSLPGVVV
jgi:hypothetical protein